MAAAACQFTAASLPAPSSLVPLCIRSTMFASGRIVLAACAALMCASCCSAAAEPNIEAKDGNVVVRTMKEREMAQEAQRGRGRVSRRCALYDTVVVATAQQRKRREERERDSQRKAEQ